jgi:hypothetical protein
MSKEQPYGYFTQLSKHYRAAPLLQQTRTISFLEYCHGAPEDSSLAVLKKVHKCLKCGIERRVAKRCRSHGTRKERRNSMSFPRVTIHAVAWTQKQRNCTFSLQNSKRPWWRCCCYCCCWQQWMDGVSNCEGLLLSCGESLVAMVMLLLQLALEKNKRRDLVDILLLQLFFVPLNGLACPSRCFTTTAATATAAMARRVVIVVGSSQQQQWQTATARRVVVVVGSSQQQQQQWQTATARRVVVTRTCNLTDYFILFYSILFYHNKRLAPDLGNVRLLLVKVQRWVFMILLTCFSISLNDSPAP